jgi:hypothetical protein
MTRDPSELPFRERLEVDPAFAAEVDARAVEAMTPRRSDELYDLSDAVYFRREWLVFWQRFVGPMTPTLASDAVSYLKSIAKLWPRVYAEFHRMMRERDALAARVRQLQERDDDRPTA